MPANQSLLIFTKTPLPGRVKTRLTPSYTPQQAAYIYASMLADIILEAQKLLAILPQLTINICLADSDKNTFCHHFEQYLTTIVGKDTENNINSLLKLAQFSQQIGADLGARMFNALHQANIANQQAVLIGCDCPRLNASYMANAFKALRQKELVLGPTADNGYCLIGTNMAKTSLFQNITWGSDSVLPKTLKLAAEQQLEPFLLPQLKDIDSAADLAAENAIPPQSILAQYLSQL